MTCDHFISIIFVLAGIGGFFTLLGVYHAVKALVLWLIRRLRKRDVHFENLTPRLRELNIHRACTDVFTGPAHAALEKKDVSNIQ